MSNYSFVRTEMLSELPAPRGETGIIRWARDNLFSGILSSILTLLSIIVVVYVFWQFIPWAFQSSLDHESRRICFDDPNITGACWGVIGDRFNQLMFGFYPRSEQWRILLAAVLLLVAIAPILFDKLPRKMIWFSAMYPFIGFALLWGGTIWGPIGALAGFAVAYYAHKVLSSFVGSLGATIGSVFICLLWWFFAVAAIDGWITSAISNTRVEGQISALEESIPGLEVAVTEQAALEPAFAVLIDPLKEPIDAVEQEFEAAEDALAELIAQMAENENSVSDAAMRSALDLVFQTQLATSDAKRALRGAEDDLEDAEDRTGAAERELKDANKFLNELQGLPDLREELAGLEVELDVLTEGLPSSVRGVNSLTSVDEDVSTEDRESLGDRLDVKSSLVAKNGSLWRIQLHSGLVGFEPIKSAKFGGLAMSLIIGIAGIAISFPLGIVLALGRQSDMFIVKTLSVGYIEFIRGVPLITLLFVASVLLNYFMPKGTNFDILLRVVIMVTLFAAAYMAEVIRGGLAALPTGQYEAADALGLDYWKSMQLIIMPQALKIAIPGIVGTFIGLFKDTTLVSIIGLLDPVGLTIAIRGDSDWNGIVWELYLFIAIMFWVFTFSMSRYSMYLERKLQTGH